MIATPWVQIGSRAKEINQIDNMDKEYYVIVLSYFFVNHIHFYGLLLISLLVATPIY